MKLRLSFTLTRYLGTQFLASFGVVLCALLAVIYLVDLMELLRRAARLEDAPFTILFGMSLLKLPTLAEKALPFTCLFAGIWTFARLTRSNELIVARAAGVSVWQFLAPAVALALIIGTLAVTVFNPLAAVLISRYQSLEAKYLSNRASLMAVSSSGLWLRQSDARGQSVVHALRVSQEGLQLEDVIIFLFEGRDRFIGRFDAQQATLGKGQWHLVNTWLTGPGQPAQHFDTYDVPTTLTPAQIQDSFASPETLSFWSLPRFIGVLEAAGFSGLRHRLHWQGLLASPLLLCAMVLLAATVSLRLTRRGGVMLLVGFGVAAGFLLYITVDISQALGLAGSVPVPLAAWAPAAAATLLGLATLFHLEDG
jgi:lipopolysaccharide export system permease protein